MAEKCAVKQRRFIYFVRTLAAVKPRKVGIMSVFSSFQAVDYPKGVAAKLTSLRADLQEIIERPLPSSKMAAEVVEKLRRANAYAPLVANLKVLLRGREPSFSVADVLPLDDAVRNVLGGYPAAKQPVSVADKKGQLFKSAVQYGALIAQILRAETLDAEITECARLLSAALFARNRDAKLMADAHLAVATALSTAVMCAGSSGSKTDKALWRLAYGFMAPNYNESDANHNPIARADITADFSAELGALRTDKQLKERFDALVKVEGAVEKITSGKKAALFDASAARSAGFMPFIANENGDEAADIAELLAMFERSGDALNVSFSGPKEPAMFGQKDYTAW